MPASAGHYFDALPSNVVCAVQQSAWFRRNGHLDPSADVAGIVLAGFQNWGDGRFERVLRGPLLPVAQTPLIRYSLDWLRLGGVSSAIVCAGRATSAVRDCLDIGSDIRIHLDYLEDLEPRGPAGCARDAMLRSTANVFVVVEGSMIPRLDLSALLESHRASKAAATVVVEIERRTRPGAGKEPRQAGGIYVFERRVLDGVPGRGYQDIKQGLLERLYAAGETVATYEVQGIAPRVLDAATYGSVGQWLITEEIRQPSFLVDYERVGEGLHHPTAIVHPSARLIGPILVGPYARIEPDAIIVGPTSIGAYTVIGAGAMVSRSTLWDDCAIGEHASVDGSILADAATVMRGEQLVATSHTPVVTPGRGKRHVSARRLVVTAPASQPVPADLSLGEWHEQQVHSGWRVGALMS